MLRMVSLAYLMILCVYDESGLQKYINVQGIENFIFFFELILGLQQLCSIIELTAMVKKCALSKSYNGNQEEFREEEYRIYKQSWWTRLFLLNGSLILIILCSILTFCGEIDGDFYDEGSDSTSKLIITIFAASSFGLVSILCLWSLIHFGRIANKLYGNDLDH